MHWKHGFILTLPFLIPGCSSQTESDPSRWRLVYSRPATEWVEALPVGNGRLGAMVFGGIEQEQLQLNEDTLWAGQPLDRDRKGAFRYLARARQLIFDGKYLEGQKIMHEQFQAERLVRSYQTLGDLKVFFEGFENPGSYERELDLTTAVSTVRFSDGPLHCTREVFSSHPDQVLVIGLQCSEPGRLTFEAELSRPVDAEATLSEPDKIRLSGRASQNGQHLGVRFESRLKVLPAGGRITSRGHRIRVDEADSVTLILAAATDYREENPSVTVENQLASACSKSFEQLRAAHLEDYRRLFDRVDLSLGESAGQALRTDELLNRSQNGHGDPYLDALLFQYGRYLLISSSRPGSMPANLQGLWNDHIEAPWNCDYHININIQMNYWPSEVTNLTECHEPFFDLVDQIRNRGRKTARDVYNCRGFVAHHTTDAWWFTSPIGEPQWGMWVMGGAWSVRHLWEHFLYTQDLEFLRVRAWPALREACEFFLDWLVEDPKTGQLVSGPTNSPENAFRTPESETAYLTMGPSMDQQIVWDLFSSTLQAARLLDISDGFVNRVQESLGRLAGPTIGSDGRLMEWPLEFEEVEPGHRHVSHLFGLHPGRQFTFHRTPGLLRAARSSLDFRLEHGGGHTGWSRAWIMNFFARLESGNEAHEHLQLLLQKSMLPNLFDNHPPFQIDGNFGATAGIAELLLQSHDGEIHFLPALPDSWPSGYFRGFRARGAVEVDTKWQDGRAREARLEFLPRNSSLNTADLRLRPPHGQAIRQIRCSSNTIDRPGSENGLVRLVMKPGEACDLTFE